MLLLNGSNLPNHDPKVPGWSTDGFRLRHLYPYAFVQVREIADRHGIELVPFDVSNFDPVYWKKRLAELIRQHEPVAVGITIRQLDTIVIDDYTAPSGPMPFDPLAATQAIIAEVRARTRAPIVLGGVGFSVHHRALFDFLDADLGVVGDPDAFFARFDDVLAGRQLTDVPNLAYRDGGAIRINPRHYFAPSPRREYSEAVLADMEDFYGGPILYSGKQAVSVELARGCPFHCTFCVEPVIKGGKMQVRDLDVVFADVDFLASRGISNFFLICSEINPKNQQLFVQVAERMIAMRERHGSHLRWNAYYLPRDMSPLELMTIARSGYLGGWNDYTSLDAESMKRARLPYTVDQGVAFLKNFNAGFEMMFPGSPRAMSFFLGHESNSIAGLRRTMAKLHEHDLLEYYDDIFSINATRVFDILGERERPERGLIRIRVPGAEERRVPDRLLPTFYVSAVLVDLLGSVDEVMQLFQYLREAVMSRSRKNRFDAMSFLTAAFTPEDLALHLPADALAGLARHCARLSNRRILSPAHLAEAVARCEQLAAGPPAAEGLRAAWRKANPGSKDEITQRLLAHALLAAIFAAEADACRRVLAAMGLPALALDDVEALPSFILQRELYRAFASEGEVVAAVDAALAGSSPWSVRVGRAFVRYLLALNEVRLRAAYRPFFLDDAGADAPLAATRTA
jgi:hypothetical protein